MENFLIIFFGSLGKYNLLTYNKSSLHNDDHFWNNSFPIWLYLQVMLCQAWSIFLLRKYLNARFPFQSKKILIKNWFQMVILFCFRNVFWRIAKHRSTEEFESIPYVSKLLNAYFWIYYGLIEPDSLLVATVNMFGAVVEIIFLIIFLTYAPPRMKVFLFFYSFFF